MFYRLRWALNNRYFQLRTRKVWRSPPIPCDPDASCEIHTMLKAEDLPLYIVAIKSLLRHVQSVSVVVHDDGTLDERLRSVLQEHVPGCRIIVADAADARANERLATNRFLREFRAIDASWRRLIDTELWARGQRRIIMDADILVLEPPDAVLTWIEHGDKPFLLGQERDVRGSVTVQSVFKDKLPAFAAALGWPNRFLDGTTGGFYGCTTQLGLDVIEPLLRKTLEVGVPIKEWGGEQATVIYLLSIAGATRLNCDRYFNFFPDCVDKLRRASVVHFFGTHRFYRKLYPALASAVVTGLNRRPAPVMV